MSTNALKVFYQNVRGLRTKCVELFNNILLYDYDIILITETWLQNDILDSELCDGRYDVFRSDRDIPNNIAGKQGGGGVLCCVRRELCAVLQADWMTSDFEAVCLTIFSRTLGANANLNIILSYMSPDSEYLSTFIMNYYSYFKQIYDNNSDDYYLLVGDFNLPCLRWDSEGWTVAHIGSTVLQNTACNFVEDLSIMGLNQFNFIHNRCNNILDLCFSNLNLSVTSTNPLTKIDSLHPPLFIEMTDIYTKPLCENKITRFNFYKGNYSEINKHLLNINWDQLFLSTTSVDDAVDIFYNKIHECAQLYIPVTLHKNNHYPKWYSRSLIKIIREKSRIHKKWKKYHNPRDYDEFKILRTRQHLIQKQCFDVFTRNAESIIKTNPKYFWTYVKSKRGGSSYPRHFTLGSSNYTDGQEICSAFNTFFESVFTKNSSISPAYAESLSNDHVLFNDSISDVLITQDMVQKYLCRLDKSKGAGADGIPPFFLSSCAESLSYPISLLFKLSLKQNVFPLLWKQAYIIPIHKKGSKSRIDNYRPISILNAVSKVFEKIVFDHIYPIISIGIPQAQHGFMQRRSTVSNLACFTNHVLGQMENGGQVDVVYTDFEKAFDRVDHVILLTKLQCLGIHGDLLRWVKSYLSNRSQAVVMGGYRSDYVVISSGVPQGSHLGPLFYNAYIFDICKYIKHSNYILYADDKKIYMRIKSFNDSILLQNDLDLLFNYYHLNNITISINKCQCITFTRKKHPIVYPYNFNGTVIERVNVVRDLGVLLDSEMSMREHIDAISSRSFRNLGFVMRTCQPFRSIHSLKVVYFAYVRCLLEYASPIWSPYYKIHTNNIEKIQKRFISHLNYKFKRSNSDYKHNCRLYDLLTLAERRSLLDMGLLYDLLHNRMDCPELLASISFNVPKKRTRHTTLFHSPFHVTNYGRNNVISRLIKTYNDIFSGVDIFIGTKLSFKRKLKELLSNE